MGRWTGRQWRFDAGLNTDHRLVTDGAYSVVRHPIYTSMLCLLVGAGLLGARLGGGFLFAAGAEQPGDVIDHFGVTHPPVEISVEVGLLGPHPAHVQGQNGFDLREAGRAVVGDDDLRDRHLKTAVT